MLLSVKGSEHPYLCWCLSMMEMIDGADDIVTKEGRSDQISLSKTKSRYEQDGKKKTWKISGGISSSELRRQTSGFSCFLHPSPVGFNVAPKQALVT